MVKINSNNLRKEMRIRFSKCKGEEKKSMISLGENLFDLFETWKQGPESKYF